MTTHQFRDAEALQFAKDLNLLVSPPAPPGPVPPAAQPAPPTPPTDATPADDSGDGGGGDDESFNIAMFASPPAGAHYRSEISMAPNPTPLMLITAVLQVASGTLAQLGIHTHLFATTPSAGPQPAPAPPYRPADTMRPTPNDVANGACSCEGCTARRNGGPR